MKIVVLDGYTLNPGDLNWKGLEALGDVTVYDRTPEDQIDARIGDAEIVLTNKTPLTDTTFAKHPSVKYVGVLATGYNVVDTEAAKKRGIPVCNIPTYGTPAVAQMAIALLLEICHHVGEHSQAVSKGDWQKCPDYCFWNYPLIELYGKTMGIIGLGKIGYSTAKIAEALGMEVLAFDSYRNPALESEHLHYVELDELLAKSDVISLHCPLFESTKGIVNKQNIAKMKDGVIILNTSRGPLIVEEDLVAALDSGKVYMAAVDVLNTEPPTNGNILIDHPRCIVTPHISWAPLAARSRLMDTAVENVQAYLKGNVQNNVAK